MKKLFYFILVAFQTTSKLLEGITFGAIIVQKYMSTVTQAIMTLTQKENPLGESCYVITFAEFQFVIKTAM